MTTTKPVRAAIYARVSTTGHGQDTGLHAMITLSSNMDMEVTTMNPALDEPADDLLDALIDLIEARADEEMGLAEWAIEALADGLGLGVVVIHPDQPEERVQRLTDALVDAFAEGSRK